MGYDDRDWTVFKVSQTNVSAQLRVLNQAIKRGNHRAIQAALAAMEAPPQPVVMDLTMEDIGQPDLSAERDGLSEAMAAGDMEAVGKLVKKIHDAYSAPPRPPRGERPRCGATTRKGTPCKAAAVWIAGEPAPRNGRCRVHGGLSTGPKTAEGKAAIAAANKRRAKHEPADDAGAESEQG